MRLHRLTWLPVAIAVFCVSVPSFAHPDGDYQEQLAIEEFEQYEGSAGDERRIAAMERDRLVEEKRLAELRESDPYSYWAEVVPRGLLAFAPLAVVVALLLLPKTKRPD